MAGHADHMASLKMYHGRKTGLWNPVGEHGMGQEAEKGRTPTWVRKA